MCQIREGVRVFRVSVSVEDVSRVIGTGDLRFHVGRNVSIHREVPELRDCSMVLRSLWFPVSSRWCTLLPHSCPASLSSLSPVGENDLICKAIQRSWFRKCRLIISRE